MRECASVLEVEENASVVLDFPVKLDRGSPIQGFGPNVLVKAYKFFIIVRALSSYAVFIHETKPSLKAEAAFGDTKLHFKRQNCTL